MDTPNIDRFRLPRNGNHTAPAPVRPPRHRADEWFLKGPIPGNWLSRAATLPGKALAVALAIWKVSGCTGRRTVKLKRSDLELFGVGYDAGRRGLLALIDAGLVNAERRGGATPRVTILE